MRDFIRALLSDRAFLDDLAAFSEPLVEPGSVNSLAQQLIKLTAPGVPDLYQGTETWDLSLVDPDNRRPVDYSQRASLLEALTGGDPATALQLGRLGGPKLLVTQRALGLRARMPATFGPDSSYSALRAEGPKSDHVIAFVRADSVITVATRLVMGLQHEWMDTALELPSGRWRDELSGRYFRGKTAMSDLLAQLPVALLARASDD